MSKPSDKQKGSKTIQHKAADYDSVLCGVVELLDVARRASARVVNTLMTATYWEIGRRIVEHEQAGRKRAGYGEEVVSKFSKDLTQRFGRGFGPAQVAAMRQFHLTFPLPENFQSVIGKSSAGAVERLSPVARALPLPWTHYVRLLRVRNSHARAFYAREALAGGWSVRQLDRQINSQFYERTALSKNKRAMLVKGERPKARDAVSADEEIRNPLVLEFLNLKDEYLYNNFAREHWMQSGENPPVGLILCTGKNDALARYAMEGLGSKMLVREYLTALPKESALAAEVGRTRELLEREAELRRLARERLR